MVGGTVGIYSSDQETKKRAVGGTGEERNPSRVFEKGKKRLSDCSCGQNVSAWAGHGNTRARVVTGSGLQFLPKLRQSRNGFAPHRTSARLVEVRDSNVSLRP
jgi:hypothetical protein